MKKKFYTALLKPATWCWLLAGVALPVAGTGQSPCATEAVAQRNALRQPDAGFKPRESGVESFPGDAAARSVVTIPVVVHIVYKGSLENISDAQVFSQIEVLNEDYRHLNANAKAVPPLFAPLAADLEMEFCLARMDPAGQPTTGITRRETAWNNIGQLVAPDGRPRINYTELGGEDSWAPEQYLNIWVCSIGGGTLGFATLPGTAPPAEDGVVIDPKYFGRTGLAALNAPHHLGRTATHEIGHYFNLRHIWGGDTNTCDDDDDVSDTPVQRSAYLGCPVFPQLSCGNSAMFMNYMDYTDDSCTCLFTLGQKNRVWAALNTTRAGLLGGNLCANSPVTMADAPMNEIWFWPNPVRNELNISLDKCPDAPGILRIYDALGQLWRAETVGAVLTHWSVGQLPAGWYCLQYSGPNSCRSGWFLKE